MFDVICKWQVKLARARNLPGLLYRHYMYGKGAPALNCVNARTGVTHVLTALISSRIWWLYATVRTFHIHPQPKLMHHTLRFPRTLSTKSTSCSFTRDSSVAATHSVACSLAGDHRNLRYKNSCPKHRRKSRRGKKTVNNQSNMFDGNTTHYLPSSPTFFYPLCRPALLHGSH